MTESNENSNPSFERELQTQTRRDVKPPALNETRPEQKNLGRALEFEDQLVAELVKNFWKARRGEDIEPTPHQDDFLVARDQFRSEKRGMLAATTQGTGARTAMTDDDYLKVILQEVFYKMIRSFGLAQEDGRKTRKAGGRERDLDKLPATEERAPRLDTESADPKATSGAVVVPRSGAVASDSATADIRISDEALGLSRSIASLSFEDSFAVLSRLMQANLRNPASIAEIMVRHVGPLLADTLESDRPISREDIVDNVVQLTIPTARIPELAVPIIEIVPTIRRILGGGYVSEASDNAKFTPLSVGELQSLTSLAVLASLAVDDHSQKLTYEPRCIFYYHEVLRMVSCLSPEAQDQDRSKLTRVVETCTNNIAAGVGRLVQSRRAELASDTAWQEIASELVLISVQLSASTRITSAESIEIVADAFGMDVARYATEVWTSRLNGVHMVSVPALKNDPHFLLSLRYAVVGLLREPIGSRDNAASAFFNAGVELLRVEQTEKKAAPLRVILNGFGLLTALRSTDDFATAMVQNDGGDCLVNLFGSIVGLAREHPTIFPRPIVEDLIRVARTITSQDVLAPRDGQKITRSVDLLRQSGITSDGERAGSGDLEETTILLLNSVARDLGLSQVSTLEDSIADRTRFILAVFSAALPSFQDEVNSWLATQETAPDRPESVSDPSDGKPLFSWYLSRFVKRIMQDEGDAFARLRALYDRNVDGTGKTFAQVGPLVASGLANTEGWENDIRQAIAEGGDLDIASAYRAVFEVARASPANPEGSGADLSQPRAQPSYDVAPERLSDTQSAPGPGRVSPERLMALMEDPEFQELLARYRDR